MRLRQARYHRGRCHQHVDDAAGLLRRRSPCPRQPGPTGRRQCVCGKHGTTAAGHQHVDDAAGLTQAAIATPSTTRSYWPSSVRLRQARVPPRPVTSTSMMWPGSLRRQSPRPRQPGPTGRCQCVCGKHGTTAAGHQHVDDAAGLTQAAMATPSTTRSYWPSSVRLRQARYHRGRSPARR